MLQLLLTMALSWSIHAENFPQHPDQNLTPGSLCHRPTEHRYPEKIAYCERNVSKGTKWAVIKKYNAVFHYQIGDGDRYQFKIDHRIPLCMGGSNETDNLWPQHETVYRVTDPLEEAACTKMAMGRLRQARAIELLNQAKLNLEQAPRILAEIQAL